VHWEIKVRSQQLPDESAFGVPAQPITQELQEALVFGEPVSTRLSEDITKGSI